jgi:hypothetical protein
MGAKMTYDDFHMYHRAELEDLFLLVNEKILGGHGNFCRFLDFCFSTTSLIKPSDYHSRIQEYMEGFESDSVDDTAATTNKVSS